MNRRGFLRSLFSAPVAAVAGPVALALAQKPAAAMTTAELVLYLSGQQTERDMRAAASARAIRRELERMTDEMIGKNPAHVIEGSALQLGTLCPDPDYFTNEGVPHVDITRIASTTENQFVTHVNADVPRVRGVTAGRDRHLIPRSAA